jgi:hypothetical protein
MPVEIRELLIRAAVDQKQEPVEQAAAPEPTGFDREAIVEECVRQVLRILERSRDR